MLFHFLEVCFWKLTASPPTDAHSVAISAILIKYMCWNSYHAEFHCGVHKCNIITSFVYDESKFSNITKHAFT